MTGHSKPIVHIDMDGVVADFKGAVAALAPHLDISEHSPKFGKREAELNRLIESNPFIFHDLEPIHGAVGAVHSLAKRFDIYFLSTPMWNVVESFSGKRAWIGKYFPEVGKKRLILTHHKHLVIGDYLIDDRKMNGADRFTGRHIHFGTGEFPDWAHVVSFFNAIKF